MSDEYPDLGKLLNAGAPQEEISPEEAERRLAAARKRQGEEVKAAEEEKGIPFVYVATTKPPKVGELIEYELRDLPGGGSVLAVFTDQALLAERLGHAQPWVKVAVLDLLLLVAQEKVGVVLNPVLAPGIPLRSTS